MELTVYWATQTINNQVQIFEKYSEGNKQGDIIKSNNYKECFHDRVP